MRSDASDVGARQMTEEYYDCYISLVDYYRLMETTNFLTLAYYPRVDIAISGELGKIGLGYNKFLRFFRKHD